MNRLETHLNTLKQNQEKGLILYITAGDPDIDTTLDIMKAMADNGVDCIELGVPFSDPIADGPVIQRASNRALKNNVNIQKILDLVKSFRQTHNTPIVLMGYYNPVYQYGLEAFTKDLNTAGGDGLIMADLPFEESHDLAEQCTKYNISLIQLIAPELENERTQKIIQASQGFLYCVSNYGTTGKGFHASDELKNIIQSVRKSTNIPLAIGFGIASNLDAKAASQIADSVIIGSWLIAKLEKVENKADFAGEFVKTLKSTI